MWKFHDFSVLQILCEINLGECRSSKLQYFAILGALNFVNLVNVSLQEVQKCIKKYENSEPLNALKWQILHFQNPKIEKSERKKNHEISTLCFLSPKMQDLLDLSYCTS